MKKIVKLLLTLGLTLGLTNLACASLIGDEVHVKYQDPFIFESQTVTVQEGALDSVDFLSGNISVNLEADSIIVDFNNPTSFTNAFFAGLIFDDLYYGTPGITILDVIVDTNMNGWSDDRIMFYDDMIMFNWAGLFGDSGTNFTADLVIGPNPTPIPSTLLLFMTGICGFALLRRNKTVINLINCLDSSAILIPRSLTA
jgi:hypothetical protein